MQYFKHMSTMRHDLKLKRLFAKYGLEGYGLYNFILESITETLTTDSPTPDLQESCADIAQFYNGDTTRINEMACFMINQGLLELDEITERITCKKIYKFLEQSQTRSDKIRELINEYKKTVSDSLGQSQTFMIEEEKNKKKNKKKEEEKIVKKIIDYLNLKANRNYRYNNKKTCSSISARLNEKWKYEDFIKVIDFKCSQWLNDNKMNEYLRPETLFGNKFESYYNAIPKTREIQNIQTPPEIQKKLYELKEVNFE